MYFSFVLFATVQATFLSLQSTMGPEDLETCESNQEFEITSLAIDPYPLEKGEEAIIDITGQFLADVELAGFQLGISYNDMSIYPGFYEQSGSFKAGDTESLHFEKEIPSQIPAGTYQFNIEMIDEDNKKVCCFTFDISII